MKIFNMGGEVIFDTPSQTLHGADMSGAKLHSADLSDADMRDANLNGATMHDANLNGATMRGATMRFADMRDVDMSGVDLRDVDLSGANLSHAMLPSPTMLLLAYWGELSDGLTIEAMKFDAANHPNPQAFLEWANGGKCPYDGVNVQRCVNFKEKRELFTAELLQQPVMSAYALAMAIIKEKTKWNG